MCERRFHFLQLGGVGGLLYDREGGLGIDRLELIDKGAGLGSDLPY